MLAAIRQGLLVSRGLTGAEAKIADEGLQVLENPMFVRLYRAFKSGTATEVRIEGKTIVHEPNVPAGTSGMTLFGENGFVMGPRAFTSRLETVKTVLQELFRLRTSDIAGAAAADGSVAAETEAAHAFADKAVGAMTGAF
jgi:hypothetical protein